MNLILRTKRCGVRQSVSIDWLFGTKGDQWLVVEIIDDQWFIFRNIGLHTLCCQGVSPAAVISWYYVSLLTSAKKVNKFDQTPDWNRESIRAMWCRFAKSAWKKIWFLICSPEIYNSNDCLEKTIVTCLFTCNRAAWVTLRHAGTNVYWYWTFETDKRLFLTLRFEFNDQC